MEKKTDQNALERSIASRERGINAMLLGKKRIMEQAEAAEGLALDGRVYMLINEDGLRLNLPTNPLASILFNRCKRRLTGHVWAAAVVGNAVILTAREMGEAD